MSLTSAMTRRNQEKISSQVVQGGQKKDSSLLSLKRSLPHLIICCLWATALRDTQTKGRGIISSQQLNDRKMNYQKGGLQIFVQAQTALFAWEGRCSCEEQPLLYRNPETQHTHKGIRVHVECEHRQLCLQWDELNASQCSFLLRSWHSQACSKWPTASQLSCHCPH